jgi:predicted transporter
MTVDFTTYTGIHTLLSFVGVASGLVLMFALFSSKRADGWAAVFFISAVATSVTGFGFQSAAFGPSHWIGVISLVVLAVAFLARYVFRLAGAWRWLHAAGVVVGLYFLVFVLIAQAFQKVPALHALAPTQSEPAFAIAELVATVIFAALAIFAAIRYRPLAG